MFSETMAKYVAVAVFSWSCSTLATPQLLRSEGTFSSHVSSATLVLSDGLDRQGSKGRIPTVRKEETVRISDTGSDLMGKHGADIQIYSDSKIAAIVAVHPPKFDFLLDFMTAWKNCSIGRSIVDFMPIFSQLDDATLFVKLWNESHPTEIARPWEALIAQAVPEGASPKSWKKMEGLAQVLRKYRSRYEFALMLDAEIGLSSCEGFDQLLPTLRKKHASKTWFGYTNKPVFTQNMEAAAKAVSYSSEDESVLVNRTRRYEINTFWNELPYVHLDTAANMFDLWGQRLGISSFVQIAQRFHEFLPLPPEAVTQQMGHGNSSQIQHAGWVFEHIVYQLHTVLHNDFVIKDVSPLLKHPLRKNPEGDFCSLGEQFWLLSDEDKTVFVSTVDPLWSVCGAWKPYRDRCLLVFHLDRCRRLTASLTQETGVT